jgi:hypothetical protein
MVPNSVSRQIWDDFEITTLNYRYVAQVKEEKHVNVWMQKYKVAWN